MVVNQITQDFIKFLLDSDFGIMTYVNAVKVYGKDTDYLLYNGRRDTIDTMRKYFVYGGCWSSYGLNTQFNFKNRKGTL